MGAKNYEVKVGPIAVEVSAPSAAALADALAGAEQALAHHVGEKLTAERREQIAHDLKSYVWGRLGCGSWNAGIGSVIGLSFLDEPSWSWSAARSMSGRRSIRHRPLLAQERARVKVKEHDFDDAAPDDDRVRSLAQVYKCVTPDLQLKPKCEVKAERERQLYLVGLRGKHLVDTSRVKCSCPECANTFLVHGFEFPRAALSEFVDRCNGLFDGVPLLYLVTVHHLAAREHEPAMRARKLFTLTHREAVSAWLRSQLHAKRRDAADRERRTVVVDQDDE